MASIIYPLIIVLILWVVKFAELLFDVSFARLGIFPLTARGLAGIVFSPFIHADFSHLVSNSFPLLVLGSMLFYFYKEVARTILLLSIVIPGFWVWMLAREAWHIGASGVVYSLAAFLFTSGVIRKHPRLMALSLIVVFMYGGMVWGIFPLQEQISWESHFMGMISGLLLAIYFRQYGPQRKLYSWELEELEALEQQEGSELPPGQETGAAVMRPPLRHPESEDTILGESLGINRNGHPEDETLERVMRKRFLDDPGPASSDKEQEEER